MHCAEPSIHGADMPTPKRRAIPARIKREILERQRDKCACGCRRDFFVGPGTEPKFDHRPPLAMRAINADGNEWAPHQHDAGYIHALLQECHDKRTFRTSKATTRGGDLAEIARGKRIAKKRAAHAQAMRDKPQRAIERRRAAKQKPGRKAWPKRKMTGRSFPNKEPNKRAISDTALNRKPCAKT